MPIGSLGYHAPLGGAPHSLRNTGLTVSPYFHLVLAEVEVMPVIQILGGSESISDGLESEARLRNGVVLSQSASLVGWKETEVRETVRIVHCYNC
ncbi:hypothetical protein TNCV_758181 [Trichonephila clavipes]|nr:hypothetical protein TNCV_758181 [Trichonephila clavipes]